MVTISPILLLNISKNIKHSQEGEGKMSSLGRERESHDMFTHSVVVSNCADLVIVLALRQHVQTVRVEAATAGVQLLSVLLAQLRAKWVDCDDESTAVSLKLKTHRLQTSRRDAVTINTLLWSKLQGLVQDSLPPNTALTVFCWCSNGSKFIATQTTQITLGHVSLITVHNACTSTNNFKIFQIKNGPVHTVNQKAQETRHSQSATVYRAKSGKKTFFPLICQVWGWNLGSSGQVFMAGFGGRVPEDEAWSAVTMHTMFLTTQN